jgi:hypothetical protein
MKRWKSRLPALIDRADKFSDSVRSRLRKITGFNNPLMILPYLGYGTADKFLFAGRVLEDEGFTPGSSADRTWRNLATCTGALNPTKCRDRIRARFQGNETKRASTQSRTLIFLADMKGRLLSWTDSVLCQLPKLRLFVINRPVDDQLNLPLIVIQQIRISDCKNSPFACALDDEFGSILVRNISPAQLFQRDCLGGRGLLQFLLKMLPLVEYFLLRHFCLPFCSAAS